MKITPILPRLIRIRDAPAYLGMDRNRFNRDVRPYLTEIPLGKQAIAFDRLEIDAWLEDYIARNGRPPKAELLEDSLCRKKEPCRDFALKATFGISKNDANTSKVDGSGRARAHLAALKQKNT